MRSYVRSIVFCITAFVLLVSENVVKSSEVEERLLRDLFTHYDATVRPAPPNHTIFVNIAFQLIHIDFDDSKGLFTASAHFVAEWEDPKLKWKPFEYRNITYAHIKKHNLWLPDISLYNSVGNKALDISDSGIIVLDYKGLVIWSMNIRMQTLCDLDMFRWPYDNHKCVIKLGSWTYDGLQVDFIPSNKLQPFDKSYTNNSEFIITNFTAQRNETYYPCCPMPYIVLNYYIEFARRSTAFTACFLMPAFCVTIMTLAAFWLPPHRGEKILLNGLTLVLIAIYQLYFIANHSSFSLRIPLIAIFYSLSFVLVSLSMIISVLVLASSRSYCKGNLPPGLSKILKSRIGALFGPKNDSKKQDQTELSHHHFEGGKANEMNSLIHTNNSYDEWTSLGIILDRVSFVAYSGIFLLVGLIAYI